MKKNNNRVIKNNQYVYLLIVSIVIVAFVTMGFVYISKSSRNIVFMDFWRNINRIIPIVKENPFFTIFDNLWFTDFGQSNYLQSLLIAIDIKFFSLNCLWEEYAGIILLAVQSTLIIYYLNKRIFDKTDDKKNVIFRVIISVMAVILIFNLNQWEILSLQFSLAFMIRILLYEIIFILFENSLFNNKSFGKAGIISFLSIVLLSQLYFPALLFSCFIVQSFYYFFNKKVCKENKFFLKSLKFWVPSILGVIIYLSFGVSGSAAGDVGGFSKIILFLKNGTLIKGFFYMLTSSVLHQNILSSLNETTIIIIGVILLILVLLIFVLWMIKKCYTRSWLSILLIGYGVISIFAIIYARGDFGVFYLTSSRYSVDINSVWIGTLIMITQLLQKNTNLQLWLKIICVVSVIFIYILLIRSYKEEFNISIYRGFYKDELISLIKNNEIDEISDENLNAFQSTPELVREGVKKMKKYKLNIFRK